MVGAILIVLAVAVVIPSVILMTGGVLSAVFGWTLKTNAETEHAGSELIETNY